MPNSQPPHGYRLFAAIGLVVLTCAIGADFVWAGQAPEAPKPTSEKSAGSAPDADPIRQCLADLKAANVEYQDLGAITKDSCVVQGAVELDFVASSFGKVRLGGKPTMSCLFARRFTAWVREIAAPLTQAYMGSNLTSIETEGGFVCRERNNRPGEKISEHAKGDAIDVAAFQLENGQNVSVKAAVASAKNDGALMKALRTSACGYFTTVLGPGSDESHKEHLHFDYGLHGPTDNYRICE